MSDYDKGYRDGVMAERQRAMLVALRATNSVGGPSREGHSLAHQIGRAGKRLPKPLPDEPEEWSVFGERRLVRDMPTAMELRESPFTKWGHSYIDKLESGEAPAPLDNNDDDQIRRIAYLEEQLADAPERIKELEGLVETLSLQLTGVID